MTAVARVKDDKATVKKDAQTVSYTGRFRLVQAVMVLALLVACGRVAFLHTEDRSFLKGEGDKRTVREEVLPAHRGIIFDRNGTPLAVSTPVISLWFDGRILKKDEPKLPDLAKALGMPEDELKTKVANSAKRGFVYLGRQFKPREAKAVLGLKVPGVYGQPEYKRFYPAGEVTSQLIGLTNIDDNGQEGIELALDEWLSGTPGEVQVIKDRKGQVIREADVLKSAEPGKEVKLSIDLRLQYLAYRELLKAVQEHKATAASLVMLDVKTGEVLAMVNQPSFNPNNRGAMNIAALRNRAITDQFEPGSVIKPFAIAAALESGRYHANSTIKLSPGRLRVGRDTVKDPRDYGTLDLAGILAKSSNVGMTKMALDIGAEPLVSMYQRVGFGQSTGVMFPGESLGVIPLRPKWRPIETATISYGYGITVTTLQLAQAYAVLANKGVSVPISIIRQDVPEVGEQVMAPEIADAVLDMMETVASRDGTARRARIKGYKVAGKTGTSKKLEAGGYSDDNYISLFAGVAPADNPRVAAVIMVDGASAGAFYGGVVAAPVFSRVVEEALRVLGVPPDSAGIKQMLADNVKNSRNEG
ncbi:peptidoglycan D,D-transpeptidase FtsI family protein [Parendozoicomonas haliclonae]|uniref:Peptidoglycan D,D-transpeptidase FtsI n=1 Tax=Parendozoicomonas haliclonae TaxID=1960125 RepID=A0A1X7AEX7_9GAMM|nr:penicillin-binding protein 2 [Parendozoicomonas haliclonae]SMA34165.1 Peptidoglycan synthase FtsI precursor [Parendozoicomonas haliclonae]